MRWANVRCHRAGYGKQALAPQRPGGHAAGRRDLALAPTHTLEPLDTSGRTPGRTPWTDFADVDHGGPRDVRPQGEAE
jgi:hypothetical protein